jgi:hypothetical protein
LTALLGKIDRDNGNLSRQSANGFFRLGLDGVQAAAIGTGRFSRFSGSLSQTTETDERLFTRSWNRLVTVTLGGLLDGISSLTWRGVKLPAFGGPAQYTPP